MTKGERTKDDFVRNLMSGKVKSQAQAYAMTKGRKEATKSDAVEATRILKNPSVQEKLAAMREKYMADSEEAYLRQWDIAEDDATPPHVRMAFFSEVQDRAGLGKTGDLHLHKHTHKYADLKMSRDQLIELLKEPILNDYNAPMVIDENQPVVDDPEGE